MVTFNVVLYLDRTKTEERVGPENSSGIFSLPTGTVVLDFGDGNSQSINQFRMTAHTDGSEIAICVPTATITHDYSSWYNDFGQEVADASLTAKFRPNGTQMVLPTHVDLTYVDRSPAFPDFEVDLLPQWAYPGFYLDSLSIPGGQPAAQLNILGTLENGGDYLAMGPAGMTQPPSTQLITWDTTGLPQQLGSYSVQIRREQRYTDRYQNVHLVTASQEFPLWVNFPSTQFPTLEASFGPADCQSQSIILTSSAGSTATRIVFGYLSPRPLGSYIEQRDFGSFGNQKATAVVRLGPFNRAAQTLHFSAIDDNGQTTFLDFTIPENTYYGYRIKDAAGIEIPEGIFSIARGSSYQFSVEEYQDCTFAPCKIDLEAGETLPAWITPPSNPSLGQETSDIDPDIAYKFVCQPGINDTDVTFLLRSTHGAFGERVFPITIHINDGPPWWNTQRLIKQGFAASDYAMATQGQLKATAKVAKSALVAKYPTGGPNPVAFSLVSYIDALSATNDDNTPVTIGQVKNLSKRFYDEVNRLGVTPQVAYPWTTNTTADDSDNSPATIGQIKKAFAFPIQ